MALSSDARYGELVCAMMVGRTGYFRTGGLCVCMCVCVLGVVWCVVLCYEK